MKLVMTLADLVSECDETDFEESWENERTANALTGVAVQLQEAGCSLREITEILSQLDIKRSGRANEKPWGRNTPKNLGDELGYSRQHMSTRLGMLEAAGLVKNIGGGVYEFIDDPREKES